MEKLKSYFEITQTQQKGILVSILFSCGLFLELYVLKYYSKDKRLAVSKTDKKTFVQFKQELDCNKKYFLSKRKSFSGESSLLEPNQLSQKDWETLGFFPKQASIVLKYKKSLSVLSYIERIKKCFVISDDKLNQLKPCSRLDRSRKDSKAILPSSPPKKDLNHTDWKTLLEYTGQEKLARRIISYRNALGIFIFVIQLKEVYALPETSIEKIIASFEIVLSRDIQNKSINQATIDQFKKNILI
ncbi:MAG: helix-hairpin-helix domain-containing protein [Flavobacteriales bacterium]